MQSDAVISQTDKYYMHIQDEPFNVRLAVRYLPQLLLLQYLDGQPAQGLRVEALLHLPVRPLAEHVADDVLAYELGPLPRLAVDDVLRVDAMEEHAGVVAVAHEIERRVADERAAAGATAEAQFRRVELVVVDVESELDRVILFFFRRRPVGHDYYCCARSDTWRSPAELSIARICRWRRRLAIVNETKVRRLRKKQVTTALSTCCIDQ